MPKKGSKSGETAPKVKKMRPLPRRIAVPKPKAPPRVKKPGLTDDEVAAQLSRRRGVAAPDDFASTGDVGERRETLKERAQRLRDARRHFAQGCEAAYLFDIAYCEMWLDRTYWDNEPGNYGVTHEITVLPSHWRYASPCPDILHPGCVIACAFKADSMEYFPGVQECLPLNFGGEFLLLFVVVASREPRIMAQRYGVTNQYVDLRRRKVGPIVIPSEFCSAYHKRGPLIPERTPEEYAAMRENQGEL